MPLAKDDFETIAQYIRENLSTWLAEQSLGKPPQVYEIELRERMVRGGGRVQEPARSHATGL